METSKKTLLEMFDDRNYTILDCTEDNRIMAITDENKKIMVFFLENEKLNINIVKDTIKEMNEIKVNHSIIVYRNTATSSAKKIIENLFNVQIELFSENELKINITKHRYYNPHQKVINKEKIYSQYGTKLPIINLNDPICRYFNFKKNDLIKITRKEGYIFYRKVK